MTTLEPRLHQMALAIARGYMRRLPCNVLREDVEQAALIGLMKALRKHPDGEGEGWEGYLRQRIRGSIIDELRAQDWATRRQRRAEAKTKPTMVMLEDYNAQWQELLAGRSESPELIAIERIDAAKAWRAPINPIDRRILRARYERGILQKHVAVREGMSEPRISQREMRGLTGMRCYLTGTPAPRDVVPAETRAALWRAR